MRRLVPLIAIAGTALGVACSDSTSPGGLAQFSRQIDFPTFSGLATNATGPIRVKIELVSFDDLVADEVRVRDPQQVNEEEKVESRITGITDLPASLTADNCGGTLTLAPPQRLNEGKILVSFKSTTQFEVEGSGEETVSCVEFVNQLQTALTSGQRPRVEAARLPPSPAVALAPGDAFPAAKLQLQGEASGEAPELDINIEANNVVDKTVTPALGSQLGCPFDKGLKAVGVCIEITGQTELNAMEPGVEAVEFEGVVDCADVAANPSRIVGPHQGALKLTDGTVIEIDQNTEIKASSGDDDQLADLDAVKAACSATPPETVRAKGEGVQVGAGTLRAIEVEFEGQPSNAASSAAAFVAPSLR